MNDTQITDAIKRIESKLDRILALLENTTATAAPTVSDSPMLYAYLDEWLTEIKAPKIKPKSLATLRSGIERYIKSEIVDKPIHTVRASEMLTAIEKVPFSYMRQVVYSIFRAVFKRAYQYDVIAENPADKLDFVYHKRKKGRALTHDEQDAFVKALETERSRPLWLFYLLSGTRCQEALTLQWQDIDDANGRIFIRGTKTPNSVRYIPLFPQLADVLKAIPHDGERVFPYTYRQVQVQFYRIRKHCGVQFRIHDLRHTFATRCLESGIATKTVAKWLGHKHTATTEEIYSHLLTDFERLEVSKFDPKIQP